MEKNILLIVLAVGIAAIAILIAVVLFPVLQNQAGCITPSGTIVSKNIYPGTFTSFEATGPVEVLFKQDKTESVRIEANENIADLVNAGVEENTLKIFFGRAAVGLRPVCNDFVTTKIFISAPVLESIIASNSATVFVKDQMLSEKLLVKATNSARLEANVSIGILSSFASNSAIIVLKGFAEEHTAQAVSGGQILASELFTKTAVLDAEDAGIVEATVLDKVEVSATTGGTVGFRGTPIIISSSTSSGGTITEIPSYASDTGNNTGSDGVDGAGDGVDGGEPAEEIVCGDGLINGNEECESDNECLEGQWCIDCGCITIFNPDSSSLTEIGCYLQGGVTVCGESPECVSGVKNVGVVENPEQVCICCVSY